MLPDCRFFSHFSLVALKTTKTSTPYKRAFKINKKTVYDWRLPSRRRPIYTARWGGDLAYHQVRALGSTLCLLSFFNVTPPTIGGFSATCFQNSNPCRFRRRVVASLIFRLPYADKCVGMAGLKPATFCRSR